MSDSEESDAIGYIVAESDEQSDDQSGSGSGAESEDEEVSETNALFDLEAADSEDGSLDDQLDENDDGYDGQDTWSTNHFFPQFQRLPPELRHHIWGFFCPDLTAKGCVYWFQVQQSYRKRNGAQNLVILEGPFLEQQTRPARSVLAVNRESRQLALKAFPDTLAFDADSVVRFNTKRDIVLLDPTETGTLVLDAASVPPFPGFSEHIRHLAVGPAMLQSFEPFEAFPNLSALYYLTGPADHVPQNIRWCTSDLVKRYRITTFEEQPGLGDDGEHLYCWPDLENHRHFAETEIPLEALAEDLPPDAIHVKYAKFKGAAIWPIVQFSWDLELRRFDHLQAWDGEGDLDWESADEDDDGEPNEYESEGIDDSELDEDSLGSDDGDDLVVLDDDSDRDEDDREDGSSVLSGSPQLSDRHRVIDLVEQDAGSGARFSSPEGSSATLRGSDTAAAHESDQSARRPSRLKRSRGGVVESGSEDDTEDDIPRKRARTDIRQKPIVLSSDDEEDERRKMRLNRRARAVISEDEDEEEDHEDTGNAGQTQDGRADWSGISSSDEDEEESEEDAGRPLSLAERLQLHREKVPIPPSDDEDSQIEEMGGDDYDSRNYADFQDDEEGNEISDDGEHDDKIMDGEDDEDDGY